MSLEQKAQVLERILALKDYSPFILICDSLAQTAKPLLKEIAHRNDSKRQVEYLYDLNLEEDVTRKIQGLIRPGISVIGVFHTDEELQDANDHKVYAPQKLPLLQYMATSIVKIYPSKEAQQRLADNPVSGIFDFSGSIYNMSSFRVDVEHRRKTGRSLEVSFLVDCEKHTTQFLSPKAVQQEEIPENLTTFNLTLNEKQRKSRENVELPFLEAQQGPEGGGAIVYQFEKDDDYDEEDPYEDPF